MPNIKFRPESTTSERQPGAAVIDMQGGGNDNITEPHGTNHSGNDQRDAAGPGRHPASTMGMPPPELPEKLQDDFNWDSTSIDGDEEDKHDEGARKVTGFWRMHPLLRALCIMIGGGIILIIPTVAVMASHRDLPFRNAINPANSSQQKQYDLQCVARSFALLTAIWVTGTFIYHLVDMVPDAVLRIVRAFKGKRVIEKTKDRLQFFIAIKAYIKMIVISAISLVCFVIMFPNSSYRFIGKVENGSASWDQVLFQINVLILFACLIIGGEKLILKVIATRFHRSAYKERIEQQAYASWVLDHLNRARELKGHNGDSSANNTPYMGSNNATFTSDTYFSGSRKELLGDGSRDISNQGFPPPLGKRKSTATSFFGQNTFSGSTRPKHQRDASKGFVGKLSNIRDRAMDGGIDMNSNQYAGRLARKLFSALHGDRDYLIVDDFLPFFEKEEDAIKAFEFFDKDGNGDISKKEMRDRVLLIYKERRSLLNALSDMGEVVGKLDMFLTAIALVIIVIIALLVFGLDALKSLATMGTLFIGWSFVFGNTFKTIFECVVFLFQVHAYDVGDIVVIAGDNLTVDKIRLLSTVFFKTDGTYTVYPNNQLATLKIQNLRRSNPQSESIVVAFDFDTPTEKLYALRDHMNEYADDHARDMSSPVGFGIDLLENTNRIQLSIGINYKSNWQDGGKRAAIKLEFSFALRNAITDLGLRYALPLQPVTMVPPPPGYDEVASSGRTNSKNKKQQQADNSDSDEDIFGASYRPPANSGYHSDPHHGQHGYHGSAGTSGVAANNGNNGNNPSAAAPAMATGMLMANEI